MADVILKVKNLNVELDGQKIIEDLSFEINEGDTLVIIGPNGAGKTVLLKALLGILPFEGEINWKEGIKIGYVPQRLPFIKDFPMSIEEFFKLKETSFEKISQVLKAVGIDERNFLENKIGKISSGQFQRILVAWGLVDDPQVLLFDEPTAGIDLGGEETIYNLLEKLRKEKKLTIILVTHDLNIVYQKATNVLCLNKRILCQGLAKEILTPKLLSQLYHGEIKFYKHIHD